MYGFSYRSRHLGLRRGLSTTGRITSFHRLVPLRRTPKQLSFLWPTSDTQIRRATGENWAKSSRIRGVNSESHLCGGRSPLLQQLKESCGSPMITIHGPRSITAGCQVISNSFPGILCAANVCGGNRGSKSTHHNPANPSRYWVAYIYPGSGPVSQGSAQTSWDVLA